MTRMNKRFYSLLLCGVLSLALLVGCGGGGGGGGGESSTSTQPTNTMSAAASLTNGITILDSTTINQIVTSDTSSITFTGSPSAIQSLKPGDIIIVGNTARKIESVSYADGQTVVKTIEPEFSEVFKTLDVSGDVYLAEEHVNKAAMPANIRLAVSKAKSDQTVIKQAITQKREGNVFTYTIEDEVIYDFDGNAATTADQVLANATVVLESPHVAFDLKYGVLSDKYATLSFKGGEKVDITLSSQKVSFNKTVKIPLGTFEVDIASAITGVPGLTTRALNVTASLNLVFDASGQASIVAGFSQDLSINAGMKATLNPVSITSFDDNTSSFTYKQPQIEGELGASASINPDVTLNVLQYALAGINNSLGVKTIAKANVALTNACYRIMADANLSSVAFVMLPAAYLNIDFGLYGLSLDYDLKMERHPKELFRYTKSLYDSGDTCVVSNEAPIDDAGADKTSNVKATVFLDGTGSYDTDGTIVSYSWTQTAGPTVALTNPDTATPSFTAPASPGTLTFKMTVTDNKGATAWDYVNVAVLTGETNKVPTANAGTDQTATASTSVTLYGTGSSDSDGSIVSYAWTQTGGGTNVNLTGGSTSTPSFTAPSTDATLTFKLTVTDDKGASASDYVQVFVTSSGGGGSTTPHNLPDTGQTADYTATFGEDSDYAITTPSYTDNGDGTITDNVTGLTWQKQDDATARTWANAGVYCDASTLGGYSDWRLPSRMELVSIVDYGRYSPAINATYFPGTSSSSYWSSTTTAYSTSYAWYVDFDYGYSSNTNNAYSYYVRCVRGGQTTQSLTDNGNGTMTDSGTHLTWQQGEGGAKTWEAALSYCEGLSLAGQTDWRLPNIKELFSIVDDTRDNPAINTTLFPNAISSSYWSSTTPAFFTSTAWLVYFNYGLSGSDYKAGSDYVRCVRGGSASNDGAGTTYSISGNVADSSNVAISGVTVTLTGAGTSSATTDSSGNYSFTGLANGSYTITPSKTGYTFNPSNKAVTISGANITGQNFVGSAAPITLASGLNNPQDIAVDSTSIYWTEAGASGAVKKVPINGGTVTTLASGLNYPTGIAVDSTSVYWAEQSGTVKKVPINGGMVTTLASGMSTIWGMTVDSTNVYWTETGTVKKVPKNGGTVTALASGIGSADKIAVDSTSVYWTGNGGGMGLGTVKKVGINGGTVTTLVASGLNQPQGIAVDSISVYWTEFGGTVKKVPINGGTVTTLASGLSSSSGIAVDSTMVYWKEDNPMAVKKVGINGGSMTTLATSSWSGQPAGIAMDSNSIYWTEPDAVKKISK